jgi:hypothetical protein
MTPFQEQVQALVDNPDQRFARKMLAFEDGSAIVYFSFKYRTFRTTDFWSEMVKSELAEACVKCEIKRLDALCLSDLMYVEFTALLVPCEEEERTLAVVQAAALSPEEAFEVIAAKLARARELMQQESSLGEVRRLYREAESLLAEQEEAIVALPGIFALRNAFTQTRKTIEDCEANDLD